MTHQYSLRCIICILVFWGFCVQAFADDQDIAKASQNPVAAMISLPMKNKFNFGLGEKDAFAYELEMQPVYPVNLGSLNLINRFIVPVVYQEEPYEGMGDKFGLRNTTYQAFFSPAEAGDIIRGLGPAVVIPTNTDDSLGNDKWAAGPAALALTIRGPWVNGVLAQHFWDFAGDKDAADVNVSTLQYFVNYNFPDFYLNSSPTMSYNWNADSDEAWTVPIAAASAGFSVSARGRLICAFQPIGMSRPLKVRQIGSLNFR